MKKTLKKALCLFICTLVCCTSFLSVLGTAVYPQGVTEEQIVNAVSGVDKLAENALPALLGKDLSSLVKGMLYNDEVLSGMLINLYSALSENEQEMSLVGIDCSTDKLAIHLKRYPQVSNALLKSNSWAEVDLTNVKWGIKDKASFTAALSAVLSPFNDILYTLLCAGTYEMNNFIKISGDNGYQNAVIPLLQAFGCTQLKTQDEFTAEAIEDKDTMLRNIVTPLLDVVEYALEKPADRLSQLLPGVAYFVDSGELNSCFNSLLSPITSNPLVEIAVFLKILDLDSLTNIDANQLVSSLATSNGGDLKLAEIDFSILASCGTLTQNGFEADKPQAFIEIFTWLIETLKLNSDGMSAILGDGSDMLAGILNKNTEDIVKFIILLFNPEKPTGAEAMVYPEFIPGAVQNTTSLTDKNLEKVYKEIDGLLDDFVKEGGSYGSIGSLINHSLYTNKNVNSLVAEIYKALEKQGLSDILALLGMDISPKGVASRLTEWGYTSVRNTLNTAESWEEVNINSLDWGFRNGSRRGFQNSLTASLRPLEPLLRVVLAEGDLVILNSIKIKGADGYNTAIIPLLEALGCSSYSIKSYSAYKPGAYGDGVLDDVLEPVFDLLDDVANKPVKTLVDRLPNILYFIESGSLEKCINNLLLPVTAVFERVPGVVDSEIDTASLTKELNVDSLAGELLKGSGIKIAEFNIKELTSLGNAVEKTSKSLLDGKAQKYTYIEADRNAIILSLLRIAAKTMKLPGNETLLMSSMDSGGAAANFDVSSMTSQFADMTEDEFIAWLYNLFFKERVKVELVTNDDYNPTIIYTPEEKSNTPLYFVAGYLVACLIVGAIIFFNRKRLYN